jgi:hypothetical protein
MLSELLLLLGSALLGPLNLLESPLLKLLYSTLVFLHLHSAPSSSEHQTQAWRFAWAAASAFCLTAAGELLIE